MSVRWERFAGDTSQFALKLSLHDDPHPLAGADADTSSSWGSLQIWVAGVNICAHTDQGELLTAAHWYLLPLLEWIAESWDPLLHEERLPVLGKETASSLSSDHGFVAANDAEYWEIQERLYEWERRHSLRAAAEGGLFPDLRIRRFRDQVELSWSRTPLAGAADIEWQAPVGVSYIAPDTVAKVMFDVVLPASMELAARRPSSERIATLVTVVEALAAEARSEVRTAWLAGLGSSAESMLLRWKSLIKRVSPSGSLAAIRSSFQNHAENALVVQGSCQAALLFGSASPSINDADALTLATELVGAYSSEAEQHPRFTEMDESPLESAVPWVQGYELADDLLEDTFFDEIETYTDVEAFIKHLGVEVRLIGLSDNQVRAVSFAGSSHRPTMLLNTAWAGNRTVGGKRFTMAHELCHLLYDQSYGAQLAVASGPWAPLALEKRANAFAAMLLMPPRILRKIDSVQPFSSSTRTQLADVAKVLRVPLSSLTEHLYNLNFINESERDALRWGNG